MHTSMQLLNFAWTRFNTKSSASLIEISLMLESLSGIGNGPRWVSSACKPRWGPCAWTWLNGGVWVMGKNKELISLCDHFHSFIFIETSIMCISVCHLWKCLWRTCHRSVVFTRFLVCHKLIVAFITRVKNSLSTVWHSNQVNNYSSVWI